MIWYNATAQEGPPSASCPGQATMFCLLLSEALESITNTCAIFRYYVHRPKAD